MSGHIEQIRIRGQVQGVGFRPMVWQLAQSLGIRGEVRNDAEGVTIIAQAEPDDISKLIEAINSNRPPLASIKDIRRSPLGDVQAFYHFSIEASRCGPVDTALIADATTCANCLREINDPANRRFRHVFANCTHCGPRFSITRAIPYDRRNTSMAEFDMCENCASEYQDPSNRRFHAQPTCCPDCGPSLEVKSADGKRIPADDYLDKTCDLLRQGYIVAIKGTGGFQLACLADNHEAVSRLRERKQRPSKPLALMAASRQQVEGYCDVSTAAAELLESAAAPVVLLPTRNLAGLSPAVAPGQAQLGFMLPNSPLHHLLMQDLPGPIVLTSGNASNEPQAIDNQQALARLGKIADYFLMHNRDIINRIDDSVVRATAERTQYLRRARGYAPQPLLLPESMRQAPAVLACGAQMKNTFAMTHCGEVTLSQHIGDLDNPLALSDYENQVKLFEKLFEGKPARIAIDRHPDYQSSRFGSQLAETRALPLIEVQHHHAHIASCLVDNRWPTGKSVIGVAMDGLGLGDNDEIWGGEFLLADYAGYRRLASLQPVAMAGGNLASRQPWRNTLAQLKAVGLWDDALSILQDLPWWPLFETQPLHELGQAIDTGFAFPRTSSCGRLFDAVAGMLGICADGTSYDGQAASELEAAQYGMNLAAVEAYPFACHNDHLLRIDPGPMWQALLEDIQKRESPRLISARFHAGLAAIIADTAVTLARRHRIDTVALSGGVFQNLSLLQHLLELFKRTELNVLQHDSIPCNDGGIAAGQAAIACSLDLERS